LLSQILAATISFLKKKLYDWILTRADKVHIVCTDTYDECIRDGINPMLKRNHWMATQLGIEDRVFAVYDGTHGGTHDMVWTLRHLNFDAIDYIQPDKYLSVRPASQDNG